MIYSALIMGLIGLMLTFLPQEFLAYFDMEANTSMDLVPQLLGAMYLSFAILNWIARNNMIGGIYSRPVAVGNFLHFAIGMLILLRQFFTANYTTAYLVGIIVYALFAFGFGYILFGKGPVLKNEM